MTIEQKRAIALASARARAANALSANPSQETPAEPQPQAEGIGSKMLHGLGQGAMDVAETFYKPTSWLQDKAYGAIEDLTGLKKPVDRNQIIQQADASRSRYDSKYGDSFAAGAGRLGGQIAASVPLMAAGGAAVQGAAKAIPALEPAAAFLTGQGGLASKSAASALGSGSLAALSSSASDNPKRDIAIATVLGAMAPVAWAGAKAAGRGIGNAIAPVGRISPEAAALAQKAADEGIKLNAAQITNSPHLRVLDSVTRRIPFSGATGEMKAQQTAFNRAVGRRFGVEADRLTPEVYAAAKARLGSEFERLSASNKLPLTKDLMDQIASVSDDAVKFGTDDTSRAIKSLIDEAVSKTENGVLPGKAYQALDSKMGQIMKAGGEKSHYVGQLRDAIRSAMDAAISPEDQAAWQLARGQYKNLKTVRDLIANDSLEGNISPARLMSRLTANGAGKEAVASGRAGDLTDIAQIGQRFLKDSVPNSGTPERLLAYGALGGASWAEPMTGLGVAGSANISRRLMNSDMYRRMLLSRAINSYAAPASETVVNPTMQRLAPYATPAGVLAVTNALRQPN